MDRVNRLVPKKAKVTPSSLQRISITPEVYEAHRALERAVNELMMNQTGAWARVCKAYSTLRNAYESAPAVTPDEAVDGLVALREALKHG